MKINGEVIRRTLLSFVYGDILGAPMEFSKEYEVIKVDRYVVPNHFKQPTGVWTDDTALVLATMDSLSQKTTIDYKDLMIRYNDYTKGKYTSTNKMFDIGTGTMKAIFKHKIGFKPLNCGNKGNRSNGNGAIMRLLPILFLPEILDEENDFKRYTVIRDYTKVTHAHFTSIVGSYIYIELLKKLIKCEDNDIDLLAMLKDIQEELKDLINTEESEMKEVIPVLEGLIQYKDLFDGQVVEKEYKGTGYVVDTLMFAIRTVLKHDNYKDAVVYAANNSKDKDTVAAITGAIGSLYYRGEDYNAPSRWYTEINNVEVIEEYLEYFINKHAQIEIKEVEIPMTTYTGNFRR